MNRLPQADTRYFLNASLEMLHVDCEAWASDILIWKEEVVFFMDMINEKILKQSGNLQQQVILDHLVSMNELLVRDLDFQIKHHEKELLELSAFGERLDEQQFRAKHQVLRNRFNDFKNRYQGIKRKIFELEKEKKHVRTDLYSGHSETTNGRQAQKERKTSG